MHCKLNQMDKENKERRGVGSLGENGETNMMGGKSEGVKSEWWLWEGKIGAQDLKDVALSSDAEVWDTTLLMGA